MNKNLILEGLIATTSRKPFLGQVEINLETGLIKEVRDLKEGEIGKADFVFDEDNLIFAGFGDLHIHAREDQTGEQNYKEDYQSAVNAALNGGCVHLSAMPNTPKPLTDKTDWRWHRQRVRKLPISVFNYVGIDAKTKPLGKPGEHFYKLYFGKSVGDLSVIYADELDVILKRYRGHHISFHVEYEPIIEASVNGETHSDRRPAKAVQEGLRLLLPLIKKYKIKAKLCHWSLGEDTFSLIKEYRRQGCDITLEVSPLHLLFDKTMTEKDPELWTKIQMNPAIQSKKDRLDLIAGLKNGFIQFLATDHAPHTEEEKFSAFAKFRKKYPNKTNLQIAKIIKKKDKKLYLKTCQENGFSGAPWLDTYGVVCVELMTKYGFTPQDIARVAGENPGKFVNSYLKIQFPDKKFGKGFGKIAKGYLGNLTVLNLRKKTEISRENLKTKVGWSPLEGRVFSGGVEAVFVRGRLVKKRDEFIEKWHRLRQEKNSNICAGLDPSVYEMGRGEKGLAKGVDKLEWSLKYIEAVAPYVVAIKPNAGSWGNVGDRTALKKVVDKIHQMGLLAIIDSKVADLGFTNDSWFYDYKQLGFDAVTVAPYAGNIENISQIARERDIAIITMGMMSNPEFKTEMNFVNEEGEKLWENRVQRALLSGVSGLVVGGTYTAKDKDFLKFVEMTNESEVLYLVPGIGAQGGEVKKFLASGIRPEKCIINSGREVMFPEGSKSTPEQQAQAAKKLRDEFRKNSGF